MTPLIQAGKNRTIWICISILLVSLHTIYFYQSNLDEINTDKLLQQIIRCLLTVGLLFMIYLGKQWARILTIVLFAIAAFGAIIGFVGINGMFIEKLPLLVMFVVYGVAIYHFGFDKSFKAFFNHQRNKK